MTNKERKLLEQFTLPNGVIIKNRIVMAPMTTWGSNEDNSISDEEIAFYVRRAKNLGMLITGCTHVSYNGIGFENEFSAYDDKFKPGLTKLATAIKSEDTKAIIQINHAGNKALQHLIKDEDVVSSSNIETLDTEFAASCKTRALEETEILEIIKNFAETTKRTIDAGFDGVEIHGAHGFLIQNFTSPYFNKREDLWGGSLENRLRFPLEIVKEVKKIIHASKQKNFILGYRLSPDEPMPNALRLTDTYKLIDELIKLNIDYLHVSLPNALIDKPVDNRKKTYLELITKHVAGRVPLIVAGTLKTSEDIEKVLASGCDFAALGRVLLTDPDCIEKIHKNNNEEITHSLDLSNLENLALPKKLVTEIIKNEGWIDIKK